jgi:hypothetical protein
VGPPCSEVSSYLEERDWAFVNFQREGLRTKTLYPAVLHKTINLTGVVEPSVLSCLTITGGGERGRSGCKPSLRIKGERMFSHSS